ncbi:hypothetical protein, conserved [Angomonas deanei]|uniref:DUF7051 domain-containing protein n=1 Tax=Angomonas deanei TaxID=59799 RepID=A0A7G2C6N6_9TRYP|nr:hypothetical protein, conserved [Angomonas deanei]
MWHVPTCRLERYFSRGDDVGQPLASRIRLFESPWGPSLKTNCLRFRGRRYFSVLIKMLKNVPTSPLGLKAFRTSLALLCMYSGEACPVAQIENESLKCVLSKLSLEIKPRRDAKVVLTAMSSACVYLQALRHEATPAWSTLKLFHRLAACLSECKVPAETCVMAYYCTVYGCTSRTPTSVHACFKTLISGLDCLPEFVVNLVKERSGALHEACEFVSDLGVMVTSDLALALSLAVLGNSMDVLPHGDWVPTVTPLVQFLEDDLVRSIQLASGCLSARQEMDEATFKSFMALMELHCMVQYDPTVLSPALLTLWRTLFDAICGGAFESDESSLFHQQCVAALECLASHNLDLFLLTTVKPLYQKRKAWRYNWIVFLSRFLRHYPGESFRCSGSLMDFTVQTLAALEDSAKEEKQTCLSAVNQMLKNVTHYLPNVSLQVQRQHLLVGQKDGMVKVYNLKNGSIVDQFMTYRNIPVLAVAYSSNHESSDIAVVPETGDSLQLWGAPRQVNTFANFFSGPQKVSFALNQTFDLSPFKSTDKSDRQLGPAERVALYRFCSLRWLSPQCVEFTSPWHVKAQFSW